MKKVLVVFTVVFMLFAFSGCTEKKDSEENATGYTFIDDLGREIIVGQTERVAALLGSYADIWVLAGGSICASTDDAFEDFGVPFTEGVVSLGGARDISLEALLAAQPDFVIASTNTAQHLEWEETLEAAGITVAYFDVSSFEDYLNMLRVCTEITGAEDRYEKYGAQQSKEIEAILSRNKSKEVQTVLVLRASSSSIRVKESDSTVLGMMLKDFGCVNIADSDTSLLETISVESIAVMNPDKVFFIQVGDDRQAVEDNVQSMMSENPLWLELEAVKNGEVYIMDNRLFNLKPNALYAQAYLELEEILYAE